MSRLGNILKAIISPFGRTLWTGTWSGGSITVPDSDKYIGFLITVDGYGFLALKNGAGTFVSGGSIATGTGSPQYTRIAGIDVSGNTWTIRYVSRITHIANGNHGEVVTGSISSIIGLIPNWGGTA